MGERERRLRAIVAIGFGSLVLLAWLPRAWAGRWIADDYCFAVSSFRDGFWHAQQLVYMNASGRFSVAFLCAAVTRLGRWTAPYIAIALVIVWLIAAWRAAQRALPEASQLEQIAAAVAFVAAIIAAAPNSYQPLIWLGGIATYGLPVVLATLMAALSFRAPQSARNLGVLGILAFLSGGCSEVAAAAQAVFASVGALSFPRARRAMLTVAIASSAALFFVGVAPGNFKRRLFFQPMPLPDAISATSLDSPRMFAAILVQGYAPFIVLIVLIALAPHPNSSRWPAIGILGAAWVVVAITLCASLYGTGRPPWGRVQFIPVAYTAIALVFAAFSIRVRSRAVTTALTAAMLLVALVDLAITARSRMQLIGEARQFAQAADRVDRLARASRGRALTVRAPAEFDFLDFLSRDHDYWTNRCMAEYYGLPSISRR